MKQYESENYVFNYKESTYIEKNIEQIATEQEKCFRYICNVLQMKPDFKINYFLFETPNGFAYINEIYAVYNESVKCISYPIMGAFTEWLINTYGIEKYKRFFKDENVVAACEDIYKCTLVEMNNLFMDYVSLFSSDEIIHERMETLLSNKLPV